MRSTVINFEERIFIQYVFSPMVVVYFSLMSQEEPSVPFQEKAPIRKGHVYLKGPIISLDTSKLHEACRYMVELPKDTISIS